MGDDRPSLDNVPLTADHCQYTPPGLQLITHNMNAIEFILLSILVMRNDLQWQCITSPPLNPQKIADNCPAMYPSTPENCRPSPIADHHLVMSRPSSNAQFWPFLIFPSFYTKVVWKIAECPVLTIQHFSPIFLYQSGPKKILMPAFFPILFAPKFAGKHNLFWPFSIFSNLFAPK